MKVDERPITAKIIVDILQGHEDTEKFKTLMEVFSEHNKQVYLLGGVDYVEVTAKKFYTFLLRLKEYLSYQYKTKDIKIADVDNQFVRNYDLFFKTQLTTITIWF